MLEKASSKRMGRKGTISLVHSLYTTTTSLPQLQATQHNRSDGCTRQWKGTKFVLWLLQLTKTNPLLKIDYNFFPSNHGQSICDVMGSQAQRQISTVQRDEKKPLYTPEDVCEAIETSPKMVAEIAPSPENISNDVTTRNGI